MQQLTALRPLVTAGAAAVGASLIALTPAVFNDLAADLQHSAAAAQHRAVQLLSSDPGVVNPIQTWVDVFTDAAANLQADFSSATAYGFFPVLEQVLANQFYVDGTLVIPAFQSSAERLVSYFTRTTTSSFIGQIYKGISLIQAANFTRGFYDISNAFIPGTMNAFGLPLEVLLPVLPAELQNLPNAVNYLLGTTYASFAITYFLNVPAQLGAAFGQDIQNVYDGFASGDLLAGLTNLLNIPGAFTGQVLNGFSTPVGSSFVPGLLSPYNAGDSLETGGLLYFLTTQTAQGLANSITIPGAPNIVQGGDLAAAFQSFLANATNFGPSGWPTPQSIGDGLINLFRTLSGVGNLAAAANLASAADVSALAPSLAADVAGLAPSIATNLAGTLAPEFGTLAAHLLTSLF